jgi:putative nucleotidyltransferase with HDIG domain
VGSGFRTTPERHIGLDDQCDAAGQVAQGRHMVQIPNLASSQDSVPKSLSDAEQFQAYFGVPLISKNQVKGVLEVYKRTVLDPDEEWLAFLNALSAQAAIAIDSSQLFTSLQRRNEELRTAYESTLEGWALALELRDVETQGHTRRVTEMTVNLARHMGVPEEDIVQIRRGAILHDIGKMAIPDSILLKPGSLTDDEWIIMRQHPVYAYQMLSSITFLRPALDIPYSHHEHWDGAGYPQGLKGEAIPLWARIFAVVDVWDALRSERVYHRAVPDDQVRAYLENQAGRQFDPHVVEAFIELCGQDGLPVGKQDVVA